MDFISAAIKLFIESSTLYSSTTTVSCGTMNKYMEWEWTAIGHPTSEPTPFHSSHYIFFTLTLISIDDFPHIHNADPTQTLNGFTTTS